MLRSTLTLIVLKLIDDSADDIHSANPMGVHMISGPIEVEGAEPGDILVGTQPGVSSSFLLHAY